MLLIIIQVSRLLDRHNLGGTITGPYHRTIKYAIIGSPSTVNYSFSWAKGSAQKTLSSSNRTMISSRMARPRCRQIQRGGESFFSLITSCWILGP